MKLRNEILNVLNKILFPIARFYWFLFRPQSFGVKCIIRNKNKLLFIRNSYGEKNWNFPGGRIKKEETPENAIKREVFEEVGINIGNVKNIGKFTNGIGGRKSIIYYFSTKYEGGDAKINSFEIMEYSWFDISNLPKLNPIDKKMFDVYLDSRF